ncbi:kallikrein-14-like [Scaptodrosophila lebanonensis]|uniref:trypsin n=1 Tax=Drosophila lebanonensis TaxID=7225 RepID=A0A6J2TA60_DROLE|nr:kallikrein-14-like [Scaptodrosophila lebanonensis]
MFHLQNVWTLRLWLSVLLMLWTLDGCEGNYYLAHPNATEPEESEHPYAKYVVSIQSISPKMKSNRSGGHYYFGVNHYCVGTIISPTYILTASHCVFDNRLRRLLQPHELLVIAGTPNRLRPTVHTQVLRVQGLRPYMRGKIGHKHDLALMRLQGMLELNLSRALGIAEMALLPPRPFSNCTVLGWGQSFVRGPFAELVTQRIFQLQTDRACHKIFPISFKHGMICATVHADAPLDVCRGDSGGPLFCGTKLTGIVSRGVRCDKSYPAIFTGVFWHRHWIQTVYSRAGRSWLAKLLLALTIWRFSNLLVD